ncbi:lytic murein transglycosylase [Candidatus Wolfebacteria bacterium]|nr:lytic murein transglycosylase [Candidatus Wolfebacteria bacterium]
MGNFFKKIAVLIAVFSFIFVVFSAFAQSNAENDTQRKALEDDLQKYEKQIDEYEATIANLKKQGKTLSSEISQLNAKIAKLNIQVKAITLNIKKLDGEINATESKISAREKEIDFNRKALSRVLQNIYENESKKTIEILLANPQLSDFFGDLNNLLVVQDNVKIVLQKIVDLKEKLIDEKETLAIERADAQELKGYVDAQKSNVQKTQSEKNTILKTTKGKESEYQKVLAETKKTAAEIRKQIFKFLGGGELDFEEAYKLAKVAEKSTGVRAALILAVLDRESALGKNVGQCDYKKAMHPTRDIPIFLVIVNELGLANNLQSGMLKVSCANADGAYGGAMGPAQFIPSTWNMYKNKIADITGSNPPNPWKNADAFVATALYLKESGAVSNERIAAAKYYCGGRWNRYVCTNVYGQKVVEKAKKFQDDIDVLNA